MSTKLPRIVSLIGRILLSVIFLLSGLMKLAHWSATESLMAAHGLPAVPVLLSLATLAEILGGLALLLGWQTQVVAGLLFVYLIPTTLLFHNFWAATGAVQQDQMFHFLKNLAIMGGLLDFSARGAGALSLDAVRMRSQGTLSNLWRRARPTM